MLRSSFNLFLSIQIILLITSVATSNDTISASIHRLHTKTSSSSNDRKVDRNIKIINGSSTRSHEFPGAICLYQRNTLLFMFPFYQYKCSGKSFHINFLLSLYSLNNLGKGYTYLTVFYVPIVSSVKYMEMLLKKRWNDTSFMIFWLEIYLDDEPKNIPLRQ